MDLWELNLVIETRQQQTTQAREDQIYYAWLGAMLERSKDFPSYQSLLPQKACIVKPEPKPEPKTSAEARAEFMILEP